MTEHWSEVWARDIHPKLANLRHNLYTRQNMVDFDGIRSEVVPKVKWYLKYRTQIWSTVFMLVGIVGGSAATVQTYIPTLKYDTATIEAKLQQVEEISEQLKKLQESVDKLQK